VFSRRVEKRGLSAIDPQASTAASVGISAGMYDSGSKWYHPLVLIKPAERATKVVSPQNPFFFNEALSGSVPSRDRFRHRARGWAPERCLSEIGMWPPQNLRKVLLK
jgi:hypothetical protein